MSSSEWAAWVQAVGSIIAILSAGGIAVWQSKQQHRTSLEVIRTEHRLIRIEAARTLLSLSRNCLLLLEHTASKFSDRDSVDRIANGAMHFDLNELRVVEGALLQIPLHSLPHKFVPLTMMVNSTVRQFRENVEFVLQKNRALDAIAFAKFFEVLASSQESLAETFNEINAAVVDAETEA